MPEVMGSIPSKYTTFSLPILNSNFSHKASVLMDLRRNSKVSMYILLNNSLECLPNYEYLDIHES